MGSDSFPGFGPPFLKGNNFSVSYGPSSRADADEKFAKLSAGGSVSTAMEETFWNSYFGSCVDPFGIQWMLNFQLD